jgi:hypothetical protein
MPTQVRIQCFNSYIDSTMKSSLKASNHSDSITSENELLTMSYARGPSTGALSADESCTEEEKVQIESLPKSTFTSFVSPAERKRRQLAKLEVMKKEQEQDDKEDVVFDAEVTAVVESASTKDDPHDDNSSDSSSVESSSSDSTGLISNVNCSSPKSAESTEKNSHVVPESSVAPNVVDVQNLKAPPQAPTEAESPEDLSAPAVESETNETAAETEHVSEIPLESDTQKKKRVAIKEVMKDSSLSQTEKSKRIQDIIGGKIDVSDIKVDPAEASVEVEPKETRTAEPVSDAAVESRVLETEEHAPTVAADSPNQPSSSTTHDDESASSTENIKEQPVVVAPKDTSDDLDLNYQRNLQRGLELKAQQQHRESQPTQQEDSQAKSSNVTFSAATSQESQHYEQRQKELENQLERQRKEMEMQLEMQRKTLEMEQQRQLREIELQQQLELEMARQRRLEIEQQQREMEFQAEQRRLRQEAENRKQAESHRLEMERMRDLERQQSMRQIRQERERQMHEELDRQRQADMSRALVSQADMSRAVGSSEPISNLSAVAAAKTLMSRMNFFRPPRTNQPRSSRYDGVDDEELNWRLDCYASLSDFTIVVHRALPGPFAPDFDVADINLIDVSLGNDGSPIIDVYYVHRVMLAVGGARSELLGRRIRDAEIMAENSTDGSSVGGNVHETILLESAADAFPILLDFCYFPDRPADITVNNAVPLVYLAQRYKIKTLLEKVEAFVSENLESANAVHFLLDAYLYKLDEVLRRAIDVTAAHFNDRVDFDPIYKLPIQLFRRIIASTSLNCESELLSLVVYSYCGEHHPDEIDVEYFREVTRPKLMPDIDAKVALMMLKFYVGLLEEEDSDRDVMEVLQDDNLTNRCITVIAKHWRGEICEPLMIDAEWEETAAATRRNLPPHEPASLHRSLPSQLQNRILERCILVAMNDTKTEYTPVVQSTTETKRTPPAIEDSNSKEDKDERVGLDQSKKQLTLEKDTAQKELDELRQKAAELEAEVKKKTKALEQYKHELKLFRRVPGIHNFGTISKKEPKLIDKTMCTYSANPDHHFPNHRRGNKPPSQMPKLASEFDNLGKQNGYVYDDGHGELLPVFYYTGDR